MGRLFFAGRVLRAIWNRCCIAVCVLDHVLQSTQETAVRGFRCVVFREDAPALFAIYHTVPSVIVMSLSYLSPFSAICHICHTIDPSPLRRSFEGLALLK